MTKETRLLCIQSPGYSSTFEMSLAPIKSDGRQTAGSYLSTGLFFMVFHSCHEGTFNSISKAIIKLLKAP